MPSLQEQIQAIRDKYQPRIDDLAKRAKELEASFHKPENWEAAINIDFEVGWADQEFSFDLPTVTMRTQTIKFDLPEFFMEQQTIIFHTPSVRMVDRKVGQYPEWHGPFKVVWKDIIISVPEPFMQEQRIIIDLPSLTMRPQEFKLDLPEFRMETFRFVVGLPQITIRKVSAETARVKAAGDDLRVDGEQIAAQMKNEIQIAIGGVVSQGGQQAVNTRTSIAAEYDKAISALQMSIDGLVAKGVDPIRVPTDKGEVNLRKQLEQLVADREKALGSLPDMPPVAEAA